MFDTEEGGDGGAAGRGLAGLSEVRETSVDRVEGLVEEIGYGLFGRGEECVEEVLSIRKGLMA